MKSLISAGVVRTRQGQGSVVVDQDEWNEFSADLLIVRCEIGAIHDVLHEVLELRIGLEASAAEAAALRASPVDIQLLRKHVDAMQKAKDTEEFHVHDTAFHQEILRIAGNRLVVKLFALLDPMLRCARALTLEHQQAPTSIVQGVAEHREILKAITRHSPAEARAASAQHVALIGNRVDEYEMSHGGSKHPPLAVAPMTKQPQATGRRSQPG
jgi:DNA-binding FadR family transcriptional regulator